MADKHKILIVEDDKYIINFISMSLKKEDYDYVIAKTCGEANALFYANRPDMIILDLGLPDGDGIEIIKNVREISKIPIIVVSARQEEEEKIQALDLGADDYVTKPFYMGELLARIRVALRKSNQIPEEKKEKISGAGVHLLLDESAVLHNGLQLVGCRADGKTKKPMSYTLSLINKEKPSIVLAGEAMEEKLKEEKKISLVLYPKKITDTGNGGTSGVNQMFPRNVLASAKINFMQIKK